MRSEVHCGRGVIALCWDVRELLSMSWCCQGRLRGGLLLLPDSELCESDIPRNCSDERYRRLQIDRSNAKQYYQKKKKSQNAPFASQL